MITKSEIQDWLADLDEDEGFAPKTINNALRVLQAFFNWLVDDKELLDRSPARKVEPLPEDLFEADRLRPHEIPVYLESCTVEYRPWRSCSSAAGWLSSSQRLGWFQIRDRVLRRSK